MTARPLWLGVAACLALAAPPRPAILWNTTASVPVGLYGLSPARTLRPGDLVVVRPDPALARTLAEAGWLPAGVPLLKPVAARAGDTVCRVRERVLISGREVAVALTHDARGRLLPRWSGCRRLGPDEVFLLSPAPGSLDGRYFGPTDRRSIRARAAPIWTASPEVRR